MHFRQAQVKPTTLDEFKGNVRAVETSPFWDDELDALPQRMEKLNAKLDQEFKKDPKLSREAKEAARKKAIEEQFTLGRVEAPEGRRLQRRLPLPRCGEDSGPHRQGVRGRPPDSGGTTAPRDRREMAGYLLVPHEKVDAKYNAGFSMYVAAWPLLKNYPGQEFQSGLFGTWMFAQYDGQDAEEALLRHRGRARLVAGHAVRHRDAEVHHGRRGPELQRVGQRPRCRQGPRLEEARRPLRHRPAQPVGALAAGRPEPQARHVRRTVRVRLPAAAAHRGQEDDRRARTCRPATTAGRCS